MPDSLYYKYLPSDYNIYIIRADYLKKFSESTSLNFGGRIGYAEMNYNSRHYDWYSNWQENPLYTDDYEYKENIGALYAKFDSKWGNLAYSVGLRYENTSLNIASEHKPSYNDLFPSVYLKYTLNKSKGHLLNLSYNRKLSRTYLWQL